MEGRWQDSFSLIHKDITGRCLGYSISIDHRNKNQTATHIMKVREAQMMLNKDNSWKQNLHDLQDRQEERKYHTQSVWNSTLSAQGRKTLNERSLKSRVGVLLFWFISCRQTLLGWSITQPLSSSLWNKVHCSCYKIHTHHWVRKTDTE